MKTKKQTTDIKQNVIAQTSITNSLTGRRKSRIRMSEENAGRTASRRARTMVEANHREIRLAPIRVSDLKSAFL
jgi:hypothetical protein